MIAALLLTALQIAPVPSATVPTAEDERYRRHRLAVRRLRPTKRRPPSPSSTRRSIDALAPTLGDAISSGSSPGVSVATTRRAGHRDGGPHPRCRIQPHASSSSTASPSTISPPPMPRASTRFDHRRARPARADPRAAIGALGIGGAGRRGRDEQPRSARQLPRRGARPNMAAATACAPRPRLASGGENAGLSATATWARSDGIDILGGGAGDRDGFENVTLSLLGRCPLRRRSRLGGAGRYIRPRCRFRRERSRITFARADTLDASIARPSPCAAGSALAAIPTPDSPERRSRSSISTARTATGSALCGPPTPSASAPASAGKSRTASRSA